MRREAAPYTFFQNIFTVDNDYYSKEIFEITLFKKGKGMWQLWGRWYFDWGSVCKWIWESLIGLTYPNDLNKPIGVLGGDTQDDIYFEYVLLVFNICIIRIKVKVKQYLFVIKCLIVA